jgi:DNA-binding NarL/FixJ family response regulator
MQNRFSTIILEPRILIREGLARVLGAAQFRIIASENSVDDLNSLPQRGPMLLVIGTGDNVDAAVRQIGLFKQKYPTGRIAVLADTWDLGDMVSAFRAGANAYFVKLGACDVFIKSLELVMLGETILPSSMLLPFILDSRNPQTDRSITANARIFTPLNGNEMPRLSTREKCILRYLVEGNSNKFIARKIDVAEATVKVHVKAILRKIRVQNRTQAAIWAMNNGSFISAADGASLVVSNSPTQPLLPDSSDTAPIAKHRFLPTTAG